MRKLLLVLLVSLVVHSARDQKKRRKVTCGLPEDASYDELVKHGASVSMKSKGKATACYKAATKLDANRHDAWFNLGLLRKEQGDFERAIESFDRAAECEAAPAEVFAQLGEIHARQNEHDRCVQAIDKALQIRPDWAVCMYFLSKCHLGLGNKDLAFQHAKEASSLGDSNPITAAAFHANVGHVAFNIPDSAHLAVEYYRKALEHQPDNWEYHYNLGNAYNEATVQVRWKTLRDPSVEQVDYITESLASYRDALKLNPQHLHSMVSIWHMSNYNGDWNGRSADHKAVVNLMKQQLKSGEPCTITSEMALARLEDPLLSKINKQTVDQWKTKYVAPGAVDYFKARWPAIPQTWPHDNAAEGRLVVGYISLFGGDSIMSYLTDCVFAHHDRSLFKVILFELGATLPEGYEPGNGVEVVLLGTRTPTDGAQLIRQHGVHVLIDLSGLKTEAAFSYVLHHPAPIQMSYLGWPCSTGSDAYDYMIVDQSISAYGAPERHVRRRFSEKLLFVESLFVACHQSAFPLTYLNDKEERDQRKAEVGLPTGVFVFACFNQIYKFSPEVADVWARILARVPDAVIWFLEHPKPGVRRIRREMERRGVAAERVIFTVPQKLEDYMEISQLADLFLDTFGYTAGATAVDMMHAGVPLVTMKGSRFVGRLATSVVTAAGFPEMVVENVEEYEERAVNVASDPSMAADLRARMIAAVNTSVLFDAPRWVGVLEQGIKLAAVRHVVGQPPGHIIADPSYPPS